MTWTISEDVDWVVDFQSTSGKINGGGENQITVRIDRAKLQDGKNNGKIQVTATADDGGQLEGGAKDVTVKATKATQAKVSMASNFVTEIGSTTAKAKGVVDNIGSSNITQHGHVWSDQRNPTIDDGADAKSLLNTRTTIGEFQSTLTNLKPATTYYVRAYATNQEGTSYSSDVSFTTTANKSPTAITLSQTAILENNGVNDIIGTFSTTDPDIGDSHTYTLVAGNSDFNINANDLRASKKFDHKTKARYNIRVRSSDGKGGTIEQDFTITIVSSSENKSPTGIALSQTSIAENNSINAVIGQLSTTDPDAGDKHTYTLVAGASDFNLNGNNLRASKSFDFETKASYPIRIRSSDGKGGNFEKAFIITITDVNEAPTGIALSQTSIAENNSINTIVGQLNTTDPDAGDKHTYTLVAGGSNFNLNSNNLRASKTFDFETKASYNIRIRSSDGKGGTFEKDFTITVSDVNEATPIILLTTASIPENESSGTDIGSFNTTLGSGASFSYGFASGEGSTDNASFSIVNNTLKSKRVFDYETKGTYTIRIQSTNLNTGNTIAKVFKISIDNVNEPPTSIILSKDSILGWSSVNTVIGTLSTTDPDAGDKHTYTLISGGSDFNINGNSLRASKRFNYDAKNSYDLKIRTSDSEGEILEKDFTINILQSGYTFGSSASDFAFSVIQTADNRFVMVGNTDIGGVNNRSMWLVKADANGNKIWDKTFGGSPRSWAYDLIKTNNDNYVLAGGIYNKTSGISNDIRLLKTDVNGNIIWDKTFIMNGAESSRAVIQTSDGGYAVAGEGSNPTNTDDYLQILKTDANGNKLWHKNFTSGYRFEKAEALIQTNDGGYILLGTTILGNSNSRIWVIKTDANGNKLWDKTFSGGYDASDLIQTSDGGYVLVASTQSKGAGSSDMWLVKINASGDLQWDRTFGGSNSDEAYALIQTSDGGYALVGSTNSKGAGSGDMWLVKTDASGNLQWDETFGGSGDDRAYSLIQTSDGGYVLAGYTQSKGAGAHDFYLVFYRRE